MKCHLKNKILYSWHKYRQHYHERLFVDCLDEKVRKKLYIKANAHRLNAQYYRNK